jgi:hypothetical protein
MAEKSSPVQLVIPGLENFFPVEEVASPDVVIVIRFRPKLRIAA